jgi:hypothetical protein
MNLEEFDNPLQLTRQDSCIWDDILKQTTQPQSINNDIIIEETGVSPVETKALCFEDLYEEKKGSWKAKTIVFTTYSKIAIEDPEIWLKNMHKSCCWVIGQLEKCPKTGRLHVQGTANSGKESSRWGFLKDGFTWKATCKDPEASIAYCRKAKTHIAGPWEFGQRPLFGQQAKAQNREAKKKEESLKVLNGDLNQMVLNGEIGWRDYKKAKEFKTMFNADQKFNEQKLLPIDHSMSHEWIYGSTGTGKTTYARTSYPEHFIKGKNKWWDGYSGEETCILEDIGKGDVWIADRLKEWADKWPFEAEFKGGVIRIRPKRIVVTSNYHIRDLWEDPNIYEPLERRFNIINKQ